MKNKSTIITIEQGNQSFSTCSNSGKVKKDCGCGCSHQSKPKRNHKSTSKMEISGKVIDSNKSPLPSATVFNVSTDNGTVALDNGEYTLEVESSDDIIEISYVGKSKVTLPASQLTPVTELSDEGMLEEIIVNAKKSKLFWWILGGYTTAVLAKKATKKKKTKTK